MRRRGVRGAWQLPLLMWMLDEGCSPLLALDLDLEAVAAAAEVASADLLPGGWRYYCWRC